MGRGEGGRGPRVFRGSEPSAPSVEGRTGRRLHVRYPPTPLPSPPLPPLLFPTWPCPPSCPAHRLPLLSVRSAECGASSNSCGHLPSPSPSQRRFVVYKDSSRKRFGLGDGTEKRRKGITTIIKKRCESLARKRGRRTEYCAYVEEFVAATCSDATV